MSTKERLEEICRSLGVTSLYAFGSRGQEALRRVLGCETDAERAHADLDLAVQPGRGTLLGAADRVRLMAVLEDLFETPRVDLVILSEAGSFLAAEAVKGELLYCEDADRQAAEELYYLSRAGDLVPFEKARIRGILQGELRR